MSLHSYTDISVRSLTFLNCSTYLSWYPASPLFEIARFLTVSSPITSRVKASRNTLASKCDTSCERPDEGRCKCMGGSTSTSFTCAIVTKIVFFQLSSENWRAETCIQIVSFDRHFDSVAMDAEVDAFGCRWPHALLYRGLRQWEAKERGPWAWVDLDTE